MRLMFALTSVASLGAALAFAPVARAQLPAPNAAGVSTGHIHLIVPDVAKHAQIWQTLGAVEKTSGRLKLYQLPGMYILLTEGQPAAPSSATSINHIGLSVKDYAAYKQKLEEVGAKFTFESAENGQAIADLPDGVRVEILTEAAQQTPIAFHHVHVAALDGAALRDWYVGGFGAEPSERRNLPSAVVPGGRVDFLPAREAPRASKGAAIDHIGFEVADLAALAAHLKERGVAFDREPQRIDAINLSIAFITDPAGVYIELTEGLDDVR